MRFYGDHSSSWVAPKQLLAWDEAEAQHKSEALTTWGKKNSKCVQGVLSCKLPAFHLGHTQAEQ